MFEASFLKETGEHYKMEASRLLEECDCSEYMERVIARLDEENLRSRKFLHPSSYSKVTHECQMQMIANPLEFLHGECKEMVKKELRQDLQNMYRSEIRRDQINITIRGTGRVTCV